ncbi:MAG: beta-ketoacyl-ACP synthase II [Actinomycetota bacterium]|jgi:3-oxoacyl-[acyl-carrier-protein] synthase II|nr:beta-ketoacyl-ACP synthase II [Actinomycetota bacterium]MCL6092970.1 beta-ketoacyl-ACP synthase II [Actinomycetota bacterium]MDA8167698.1 beta-ketoacyl-ACP synthase II [Actinomycetota bacterium]
MNQRRVVITGMGIISPLGIGIDEYWQSLSTGRSGVGPITQFDASGYKVRIAAEVKDFEPTDYVDRKSARRMDRFAQLSVAAAGRAAENAGLDVAADAENIGVLVASGIGGVKTFEKETAVLLEKGPDRISPFFIPMEIANMASAQVSIHLGARGPVSTVCTACSAAANAIGDAFEIVKRGAADVMLTGGSEASISPVGIAAFAQMGALSARNDEPERASRPFDSGRDGFVMGEGSAILVLEERERALARGARILAEVVGYGMTADAFHMSLPEPSGENQARAMLAALQEAGLKPADIDYINAHGTSTPPGDRIETLSIKQALGDHAGKVAVSSTKSMMGHCLGASGALEAAACVLAIDNGVIPPTINLDNPDPECDLDYVPNHARSQQIEVAASNSFGFGGHNVTLIFRAV